MKLKKGVKRILIIGLVLLIAGISLLIYSKVTEKPTVKKTTVVNEIKEYGYTLKSNKSKTYKDMFYELQKILDKEEVDEEAYVSKIAQMFILDFYSLSDKLANTDVGGIDFVHTAAKDNFLVKAEDTIYKYVQNNIYGNREQDLPTVKEVSVESVESVEFTAGDHTDENSYQVTLKWTYTKENDYQNEATLLFIHEDNKLSLVEME